MFCDNTYPNQFRQMITHPFVVAVGWLFDRKFTFFLVLCKVFAVSVLLNYINKKRYKQILLKTFVYNRCLKIMCNLDVGKEWLWMQIEGIFLQCKKSVVGSSLGTVQGLGWNSPEQQCGRTQWSDLGNSWILNLTLNGTLLSEIILSSQWNAMNTMQRMKGRH